MTFIKIAILGVEGVLFNFRRRTSHQFHQALSENTQPLQKDQDFCQDLFESFCQLTKEKLTTTLPQNQPFTLYSKTSTPKSRSKFLFFHELFFNFFTPFQKLLQKKSTLLLTKITIKNLKLKTPRSLFTYQKEIHTNSHIYSITNSIALYN